MVRSILFTKFYINSSPHSFSFVRDRTTEHGVTYCVWVARFCVLVKRANRIHTGSSVYTSSSAKQRPFSHFTIIFKLLNANNKSKFASKFKRFKWLNGYLSNWMKFVYYPGRTPWTTEILHYCMILTNEQWFYAEWMATLFQLWTVNTKSQFFYCIIISFAWVWTVFTLFESTLESNKNTKTHH